MSEIEFSREWCMPNSNTFEIKPIRETVQREIEDSNGEWIDPFSGESELADVTNDLNPEIESDYSLKALEFLQRFEDSSISGGVLFDPPYSPRQIKECYDSIGLEVTTETTQSTFWSDVKGEIARICSPGATVITCGWNSGGIGKNRGYSIREILLVAHGGWHNDTIVTVEDYTSEKSSLGDTNV